MKVDGDFTEDVISCHLSIDFTQGFNVKNVIPILYRKTVGKPQCHGYATTLGGIRVSVI